MNKNITQFKAKQVVKSYLQQYEIDFTEMFTVVIKSMVFYIFFAILAYYNFKIR